MWYLPYCKVPYFTSFHWRKTIDITTLISPLVRSKARSSFEKCSANLIQLQAALASPAYFHDGSYQPYPLTDSERANIFGSGNYLILSIILRKAFEITHAEIPKCRICQLFLSPFVGINSINSVYDKRNVQIEEPRVKNGGRLLNLLAPLLQIPGQIIKPILQIPGQIIKIPLDIIRSIFRPRPRPQPPTRPQPPPQPPQPPPPPPPPEPECQDDEYWDGEECVHEHDDHDHEHEH